MYVLDYTELYVLSAPSDLAARARPAAGLRAALVTAIAARKTLRALLLRCAGGRLLLSVDSVTLTVSDFGRHSLGAGVPAFPAPARRFPRSSDPRRNRYAPQGTRAAGGTVGARARGPAVVVKRVPVTKCRLWFQGERLHLARARRAFAQCFHQASAHVIYTVLS